MCPYTANQQHNTQDPRRGTWVQVKETDSPGPETARTACEGPLGPDEGRETSTSPGAFLNVQLLYETKHILLHLTDTGEEVPLTLHL